MVGLRSRRVLQPRLSLSLDPTAESMSPILATPTFPSLAPHHHPLLLLMPWVPLNLLLLPICCAKARSTLHKPTRETVDPPSPHSSPFQGTTPNWSRKSTYISQARSFCSLLHRSCGHQRSPSYSGTSVVHAVGAAWRLALRRRHRPMAMSDVARASLEFMGG